MPVSELFRSDLDVIKATKLTPEETFLAQMLLIVREWMTDIGLKGEKPLQEWDIIEIINAVKSEKNHARQ